MSWRFLPCPIQPGCSIVLRLLMSSQRLKWTTWSCHASWVWVASEQFRPCGLNCRPVMGASPPLSLNLEAGWAHEDIPVFFFKVGILLRNPLHLHPL